MDYFTPFRSTTWNRQSLTSCYTNSTRDNWRLPIEQSTNSKLNLTILDIEKLFEKDEQLHAIYLVVEANLEEEEFRIPQLASQLYTTRTTLYREVKKKTGRSIITLVKIIRLIKADDLLKRTDLAISDIAYQVGFKAPSHFTTSYKKEYGCSPKEARKL